MDGSIIADGPLDPKDRLYKLCDLPQLESGLMVLISQADKRSRIWHERLRHLNFHSLMKMMVTQNMVVNLPKVLPPDGVCKGCVLGKHHQAPFDSGNAWHALSLLELVHSDLCCINKPL